jgi:hypothetical protein
VASERPCVWQVDPAHSLATHSGRRPIRGMEVGAPPARASFKSPMRWPARLASARVARGRVRGHAEAGRGGARVPCRAHTRHRMHGPTRLPRGAPGKACRATRTYVRCAAAGTGPPPLLLFPLAAPADGAIGAPRLWPLSPPLLRPVVMMTASLERYGRLVSWEEWTEITPLPSFPWIPFLRPPFAWSVGPVLVLWAGPLIEEPRAAR